MFKKQLTIKIILFLVLTDILETFTHLCFKKSALAGSGLNVLNPAGIFEFIVLVFSSPFVWLGLLTVLSVFIIWSSILSKIDLSVAVPIASFSYILVPLTSVVYLHEKISMLRWLGIFFILIGVIFVSLSSTEKESPLR